MWQKLLEMGKNLLTLTTQVEKNTQDIKELRKDLKELTTAVQNLAFAFQRNTENDAHEREKLACDWRMPCSKSSVVSC